MTSPETLNTKVAFHKVIFPLVTDTVYSNARFDRYEIFNQDKLLKTFWTDWTLVNDQVLRVEDAPNMVRALYKFHRPLTHLSNAYSYIYFW
jgi:hypothetical protein